MHKKIVSILTSIMVVCTISGCVTSSIIFSSGFPEQHDSSYSHWTSKNTELRSQPDETQLNRIQFVDENDEPIRWADVWMYIEGPSRTLKNRTSYESRMTDLYVTNADGVIPWPTESAGFDGGVKYEESMHCAIGFSHEDFGISFIFGELSEMIGSRVVVRDQRRTNGPEADELSSAIRLKREISIKGIWRGQLPFRVYEMWTADADGHLERSAMARPDWIQGLQDSARNGSATVSESSDDKPNHSTWTLRLDGKPTAGHLILESDSGWPKLLVTDQWGGLALDPNFAFEDGSTLLSSEFTMYFLYDGDMHECEINSANGRVTIDVEL